MSLAASHSEFIQKVSQCDGLVAAAHRQDANGNFLFAPHEREQITTSAFLGLFIAWETFIESTFTDFMLGEATNSGTHPIKYVSPTQKSHALKMIVGVMKFFDYANHDFVLKQANLFFDGGYPYEQPIRSIFAELGDLKTLRNASAHLSSTTRRALDSLALRIFGQPHPGISLYQFLFSVDPRSATNDIVFASYRDKLLAAAQLIVSG